MRILFQQLARGVTRPLGFLITLLCLHGATSADAQAPTNGLVGFWRMDEGSGATTANSAGSGIAGVLTNGPTWASSVHTRAINFDGVDDFVKVTDPNLGNQTAMTISMWMNARSAGGNETGGARILSKGDNPTSARYVVILGSDNSSIQFNAGFTTAAGLWKTPAGSVSMNTWHHVVLMYTHGNVTSVPRIFIDGVPQTLTSLAAPSGSPLADDPAFYIGSRGTNNNRVFDGLLDEVRLYNRELDPAEVIALRNAETVYTSFSDVTSLSFLPTNARILNPERGFYGWTELQHTDYSFLRASGRTLTRAYYRLDAYRSSPLPQSVLDQVAAAFQRARAAGVKIIVRFAYNFPPCVPPACPGEPDASTSQILSHLQQLRPVLIAGEDVISSMEAGFIGFWGEWHQSTTGADSPSGKQAVVDAVLAALPSSRMVAVRMPYDIRTFQGNTPIQAAEAFNGTNRTRIGSHQDCFLASDDDWGTWGVRYEHTNRTWVPSGYTRQQDKDYIRQNGLFSVVGGETCNLNQPRSDCATALAELEYLRFSNLNEDFEPNIIQNWKNQGCFDEIHRRLGYRYEILSGSHSNNVVPGGSLQLNLSVANRGWGALFNARPVFAVLVSGARRFTFPLTVDPRFWAPGSTSNIAQSFVLPNNIPSGIYTLGLWMPDQAASIRADSRFAIRAANQNVWSHSDGLNVLSTNVVVRDTLPPAAPDGFGITP